MASLPIYKRGFKPENQKVKNFRRLRKGSNSKRGEENEKKRN